jgi:hypothetical protein
MYSSCATIQSPSIPIPLQQLIKSSVTNFLAVSSWAAALPDWRKKTSLQRFASVPSQLAPKAPGSESFEQFPADKVYRQGTYLPSTDAVDTPDTPLDLTLRHQSIYTLRGRVGALHTASFPVYLISLARELPVNDCLSSYSRRGEEGLKYRWPHAT